MELWMERYCRLLDFLMAAALATMVAMVFGNVVLRYAFNTGITVSEEVSRWLFIWATFLGAVVALRERGHLGVDMVVNRLPAAGKRACLVAGHALMLGIVALLFQGSLEQVRINWDVTAPTTGWSMAWVPGASLVFAALAGGLLLLDLARVLAGRLRDDELVMVQESEEAAQLRQVLAEAGAGKEIVR